MGKYSNHPCTSLAVCQTTLLSTGSCTCTLPDRTKAACLADQKEMPAWTGCCMQPLVCCLNATGSSPAPTPTTWFCHHIATERHSSLGQSCSSHAQPASIPLVWGNVLMQSQQKCFSLWSSLTINKKPLQLLTLTGFSSSQAEDQSWYNPKKETGMPLMVLKAVLPYWGGHSEGTQSTGIQTYLMCTMPASKQVKAFPFHKYFNVIIFCVKVPKRYIQKP